MLINLRNALMAGKRLPYDAEVEYIGTSWQDDSSTWHHEDAYTVVPCRLPDIDYISVTYGLVSASHNDMPSVHGVTYASNTMLFGLSHNRNSDRLSRQQVFAWNAGSAGGMFGNWKSGSQAGVRLTSTIDLTNNCYYDQAMTRFEMDPHWSNAHTTDKLGLFCAVSAYDQNTVYRKSNGYIYAFTAVRDGEVVLGLIPVRVSTTGYFYDRVSGALFGNAGTGAFVIGPDKAASNGGGGIS